MPDNSFHGSSSCRAQLKLPLRDDEMEECYKKVEWEEGGKGGGGEGEGMN